MKRIGASVATLAGIAFLLVSWEQPAYAYLDPGAGSLLLQVLMFGGVGRGSRCRQGLLEQLDGKVRSRERHYGTRSG